MKQITKISNLHESAKKIANENSFKPLKIVTLSLVKNFTI